MSDELKEVLCRVCQRNKMQISVKSNSGVCLECVSGGVLVLPPEGLKPIKKAHAKRVASKPIQAAKQRLVPFGALSAWVKAELATGKGTKEVLHAAIAKWPEHGAKKLRSTVYATKNRMKGKTEVKPDNEPIQPVVSQASQAANPVGAVEVKAESSI